MKNKKIIGLTGFYCSGKNHVAQFLEKRGLAVLDLDKLGHEIIEKEKEPILARFGRDILTKEGGIDRKRLGEKVFGKKEELAALEELIHPPVNRQTLAWIQARQEKACVINAALLHRSAAFELLDAVIIVEAPFLLRLLRARRRDRLNLPSLFRRFASQREFGAQFFNEKTDIYRVDNSSIGGKKLDSRIDEILSLLGIT
ncbi:MAG: dephospho-CoA kinase [Treponema sp.]|nr:dephospho-CoA kinase [Treponema sp.]